jgi:ubiquinone/menaquinone biosynthesis C-methylase UbiE
MQEMLGGKFNPLDRRFEENESEAKKRLNPYHRNLLLKRRCCGEGRPIPGGTGADMVTQFLTRFFRAFPRLKGFLWEKGYDLLSKVCRDPDWTFINYGYSPVSVGGLPHADVPDLAQADVENRFCIQLYHHLASRVELAGKRVLEIGSGRGGGAEYLHRYHRPAIMTGVDFSQQSVAFSRRNATAEGLEFEVGRAEALPFDDGAFDVVFNVESSHCYGEMAPFLVEVRRVLSPGGFLLFADFRGKDEIDALRRELLTSGLIFIEECDITGNVLVAMDLDHDRKCREVDRRICQTLGISAEYGSSAVRETLRRWVFRFVSEFVGVRNSAIFKEFETRNSIYISCVMQKPLS